MNQVLLFKLQDKLSFPEVVDHYISHVLREAIINK